MAIMQHLKMSRTRPATLVSSLALSQRTLWSTLFVVLLASTGVSRGLQLEGRWREDQYKRTGLYDYLYGVGKKIVASAYMYLTRIRPVII